MGPAKEQLNSFNSWPFSDVVIDAVATEICGKGIVVRLRAHLQALSVGVMLFVT